MKDTTFAKNFVLNDANFALVASTSSGGTPIKWIRFPKFYLEDYFYMEKDYWDAVTFVPKRNIIWHGFGCFSGWDKKNMEYTIKWYVGEDESEEHEFNIEDERKDPEKKWFEIYLSEMDEKPIRVSEGTEI